MQNLYIHIILKLSTKTCVTHAPTNIMLPCILFDMLCIVVCIVHCLQFCHALFPWLQHVTVLIMNTTLKAYLPNVLPMNTRITLVTPLSTMSQIIQNCSRTNVAIVYYK